MIKLKKLNPITEKYLIVFMSIFVFTLIAQVYIQNYIHQQEMNSSIVNIAGRQRMLSQKIAKLIYKGEQGKAEIEEAVITL